MDLWLDGSRTVVVGGAQGIGRAIANAFLAEGADVAVFDIASAQSDDREESERLVCEQLDVTQPSDFEVATTRVRSRWGQVDHLVYAAGAGSGKLGFPFWNLSPEDWNHVWEVNLQGAVRFLHAFRPLLGDRTEDDVEPSILFIASIAGQIGSQTDPPYSAAKAALLNFMRCAARDFAAAKIRVNAICPGMVKTELNRSVWRAWREASPDNTLDYDAWAEEKIARVAPLARWQTPEEVAALATFLASPHARNITGQTLNIDGGQVMH